MPNLEKNSIKFDEAKTFDGYQMVYKVDSRYLEQQLSSITSADLQGRKVLIQLDNTVGLTKEMIERLPDNVDIRVVGGYTEDYMNGLKDPIGTKCRQKATYTKSELSQIIDEISKIESGINPSWSSVYKALYLYESLKKGLTYYIPANDQINMRGREYDTLTGLITKDSLCAGYSHIYQELCTRQGIKCSQIGGTYQEEGKKPHAHAWDVITIDDKSFLVDIIWDSQDKDKGIDHTTGFGLSDVGKYKADNMQEIHQHLSAYNHEQVEQIAKQFNISVTPKVNKRENFMKEVGPIAGIDKVSDRVFDTIIQRYNLQSNNTDKMRMYECMFLTLKSYPEYKEQALEVARIFEDMAESARTTYEKREKEWGTYMDEFDKYETIPVKHPYHTLGNYAITLSDIYSFRAEISMPEVRESLDFKINNETTKNIDKYKVLQEDLAQAQMELPSYNNATMKKASDLVEETERQNKAIYEGIRKEIQDKAGIIYTARYTSLLNNDNPIIRDQIVAFGKELEKGLVNVYDIKSAEARLKEVSSIQSSIIETFQSEMKKQEEREKQREEQKAKLSAVQQKFKEIRAKEKHTFNPLYTDEELQALHPEQPDARELLKEALAALGEDSSTIKPVQESKDFRILEDGTIERTNSPQPTIEQAPEEKDPSIAELESTFKENIDFMEKQYAEFEKRKQDQQPLQPSKEVMQPNIWSTLDENGNEFYFKNIIKDGVVMDSVMITPEEYQLLGGVIKPVEEMSAGKHR